MQGSDPERRKSFVDTSRNAGLLHALRPHITQLVAWDPRKNALLKVGNKSCMADENHRSRRAESYDQQLGRAVILQQPPVFREFTDA
jgi:hypothetical protein